MGLLLILSCCCACNSGFNPSGKKFYLTNLVHTGDTFVLQDGNRKATLTIREAADNTFDFSIHSDQYADASDIAGTALGTGFKTATFSSMGLELAFSFNSDLYITISQKGQNEGNKAGIYEGPYFKASSVAVVTDTVKAVVKKDSAATLIFLDDAMNSRLRNQLDDRYPQLVACMRNFSMEPLTEGYTDYKVYTGSATGQELSHAGIISIHGGNLYFVGLVKDGTVYLYANEVKFRKTKGQYPKLIGDWIAKVKHDNIEYNY
ncbi:MAG: hypothetical protein WCG87_04910 [Bacteroidota bacterium]